MLKRLVLAVAVFLSIFTSCLRAAQTLHLNIAGDPDTLDPRISNNINAALVISMLFQGLTEVGEDGKVNLALANSVTVSEDGKTYIFQLKKTKWSDGKELTAEDFVYSWRSVLDPKTLAPCANLLYPIKNAEKAAHKEVSLDQIGVRAKDKHTFIVELEKPVPFFLDLIAASVFFPVPKHQVENNPKWGASHDLIINGPFKVLSWTHFDAIVLEKNAQYWGSDSILLDQIHISMVGSETTALQMFNQGKIDWIGGDYSPIPLDALPDLKKKEQMHCSAYGGTRYCALNTHVFPFNNLNLRKAFSIAVNRQALIDHVTLCDDEVATNMIASVFKQNKKDSLFPDGDAKLAKSYLQKGLEELGIEAKDLQITFKYDNAEASHSLAQALQQQWKEVLGITVKLESAELKTFVSGLRKRDFQMGLIYWMVHYNSPMDILDRYRSKDLLKNYPGWENAAYTQLLDAYFSETDEVARQNILSKAEEIFIADMPVIPLFHFSRPYLCNPSLKNLQVTPIGDVIFSKAYFTKPIDLSY